jgi:hypothetical protein
MTGPRAAGGQGRDPGVAERDQGDLLGWVAAAGQQRPGDGARAQHGLDPGGGPGDPGADHGLAPERQLPAGVADELVRDQPQPGDSALCGPVRQASRRGGRCGLPAAELPADAFGYG